MRALVFVRRCVDYSVAIRIRPDGDGVETQGVKHTINPFDEIAAEEAVRLKEKGIITEIVALGMGAVQVQDTIRHALAMGADRGVFIPLEQRPEPLACAKLIANIARRERIDLLLMGKQAIDDDCGQEGAMVATVLGWDLASNAAGIDASWIVTCETDGGIVPKKIDLPAVITTDLRLNEPRPIKLPQVLDARKKPIETVDALPAGNRLNILSVRAPQPRPPVLILHSVDEVLQRIQASLS